MTNKNKIELLNKLIVKSQEITVRDSSNPTFKVWKNNVERTLTKIFGVDSFEVNAFKKLKFFYSPSIYSLGDDFTQDHIKCFNNDFELISKQISSYVEELTEDSEDEQIVVENLSSVEKIFISHSSKDSKIVEEIIEILETIGLTSEQIFCSSFEGYGIGLGENFLERIKSELNSKVLVIFVLSENFYASPISLCEMGASWIKTNEHIPILIPPFDYKDIEGVIPLTQGFKINEPLKLNLFKQKIEEYFVLNSVDLSSWERKRDRIINRIEKLLK